jgi:hypothetical protein
VAGIGNSQLLSPFANGRFTKARWVHLLLIARRPINQPKLPGNIISSVTDKWKTQLSAQPWDLKSLLFANLQRCGIGLPCPFTLARSALIPVFSSVYGVFPVLPTFIVDS